MSTSSLETLRGRLIIFELVWSKLKMAIGNYMRRVRNRNNNVNHGRRTYYHPKDILLILPHLKKLLILILRILGGLTGLLIAFFMCWYFVALVKSCK